VHHACPDVGAEAIELILENNLIDPPAVLSSLINDLVEVEEDVYFLLEDYHWLSASRIHQMVAYFLKHAPCHCHVVLTTRTEPPLPLATLRAQNQLIKIDAAALRFDMQETLAFLDGTRPGVLEPSEVQLLQRKTEEWPAALRIIVSMASQCEPDLKDYLHGLSGSQRPIAAYLSEMLDALPVKLVDFMLRQECVLSAYFVLDSPNDPGQWQSWCGPDFLRRQAHDRCRARGRPAWRQFQGHSYSAH
jgi:LuxR family transcriptional regulator, maltose regulon positive regulatory protein